MCPERRRKQINVNKVRKAYGIEEDKNPNGKQILEAWADQLKKLNDSCVVVTGDHVWTFA